MHRNKTVEEFISAHSKWQNLLLPLRALLQSTELEETIKWGVPVYTLGGKNVAGLTAFNQHVAIWFFWGALLNDKSRQLVNAQEGVTKAQRQWRFDSIDQIDKGLIKAYLDEAIENQKQGKSLKPAKKKAVSLPQELTSAFSENRKLKSCFDKLTPYKKAEYAEFIGQAKREDTRVRRLEKIIPMIQDGKGLHDKYRC